MATRNVNSLRARQPRALADAPLELAAEDVEEAVGAQAQEADRGGGAAAFALVAEL